MDITRTFRPLFTTTFRIVIAACLFHIVNSECYDSKGLLRNDAGIAPCPEYPTTCCAINFPNRPGGPIKEGPTSDECLDRGLCQNRYVNENGIEEASYWTGFCTSNNWNDVNCPNSCMNTDELDKSGRILVTRCPTEGIGSSQWCCGNSTDCCSQGTGLESDRRVEQTAFPVLVGWALTTSLSITATTTKKSSSAQASETPSSTQATGGPSNTASGTPITSSEGASNTGSAGNGGPLINAVKVVENRGLSTAVKAGIGVGASVGGISLLALGFLLARWNIIRKYWSRPASSGASSIGDSEVSLKKAQSVELDESNAFHEMQSNEDRRELYGDGGHHEMQGGDACPELPHDNVRCEMQG